MQRRASGCGSRGCGKHRHPTPTTPPSPGPRHAAPGSGPLEPPRLARSLLVPVSIEEASDGIEAGLALEEDVMRPKGAREGRRDEFDVMLRLANMPEVQAACEAWITVPFAA